MQAVQIRSLVGERRPHVLHGQKPGHNKLSEDFKTMVHIKKKNTLKNG